MKVTLDIGERQAATNIEAEEGFTQIEGWRIVNMVICPRHQHGVMLVMKENLTQDGIKCLLGSVLEFVENLQKQITEGGYRDGYEKEETDCDFRH